MGFLSADARHESEPTRIPLIYRVIETLLHWKSGSTMLHRAHLVGEVGIMDTKNDLSGVSERSPHSRIVSATRASAYYLSAVRGRILGLPHELAEAGPGIHVNSVGEFQRALIRTLVKLRIFTPGE
jgi:hypothetical protein